MSPPNSLAIACDLLAFVWRHDEFVYRDFRMQAQLALSLLLIHFYGLDTSELVGDYSQSRPKAIQWGDIEFLSLPRSSGTYCTIAARLCITKRLDTGRKEYIIVHEYQADRAYCPVSLLIALALDDGVFTEIQTTEQFAKEYASAVQKPLLDRLAIRDEKLKLPVIRRYCAPAKISLTNALSLQQLTLLLKEVDLRRGTSDLIPLIAALEDVLLKHSDNDAVSSDDGQFCPSENVPLTETQIMLSALPTEADLMSFAKLGPLAGTPQKYPTRNARTAWVYDRPRTAMLALLDAQAYGRLVTLPEMIAALQPRFAAPRWHYPSPMEDDTPICSELKLQPALSQLELYMCKTRTFLNKAITVQMKEAYRSCMWTGCQFDTGPEYLETIAFHISDHIAESSGICRWMQCGEEHANATDLGIHLANAHQICSSNTQPDVRFCFSCVQFFYSVAAWSDHCVWHIENLEMSCERVVRRGIILQPFTCPFCLGGRSLLAYQRYLQFPTEALFRAHLARHEEMDYCRHPLCDRLFDSSEAFAEHMTEHNLKRFFVVKKGPSDVLRCKVGACKNQSFETVKACFRHLRTHSAIQCPFPGCLSTYGTFRSVKTHMSSRHKIDELTCVAHSGRNGGFCRARVKNSVDMDLHMALHADVREIDHVHEHHPDLSAFGVSYESTTGDSP